APKVPGQQSALAQLFTENDTNAERLFDSPSRTPYVKDAFHRYVVNGETKAVNPSRVGTKAAFLYNWKLAPGQAVVLDLRLSSDENAREREPHDAFGHEFVATFDQRKREADEFYGALI